MCLIIINKLINNSINMNETMSLLTATSILVLGGLGLYIFKSSDDENQKGGEEYNEGNLFNSSFWGLDSNDNEKSELDDTLRDFDNNEDNNRRSKTSNQTKRQRRTGGTKRKY